MRRLGEKRVGALLAKTKHTQGGRKPLVCKIKNKQS